jgi:hypothetical protein
LKWFHLDSLKGIDGTIRDILARADDIDKPRRDAIAGLIIERAKQIEQKRCLQLDCRKK